MNFRSKTFKSKDRKKDSDKILEEIKTRLRKLSEQFSTDAEELYQSMAWTWYGDQHTPSKKQIKNDVLRRINRLEYDENFSFISSGRYRIGYTVMEDEIEVYIVIDPWFDTIYTKNMES